MGFPIIITYSCLPLINERLFTSSISVKWSLLPKNQRIESCDECVLIRWMCALWSKFSESGTKLSAGKCYANRCQVCGLGHGWVMDSLHCVLLVSHFIEIGWKISPSPTITILVILFHYKTVISGGYMDMCQKEGKTFHSFLPTFDIQHTYEGQTSILFKTFSTDCFHLIWNWHYLINLSIKQDNDNW